MLDYIAFQLFSFTLDAISGLSQQHTRFCSRPWTATLGKDPRLSQQIGLTGQKGVALLDSIHGFLLNFNKHGNVNGNSKEVYCITLGQALFSSHGSCEKL